MPKLKDLLAKLPAPDGGEGARREAPSPTVGDLVPKLQRLAQGRAGAGEAEEAARARPPLPPLHEGVSHVIGEIAALRRAAQEKLARGLPLDEAEEEALDLAYPTSLLRSKRERHGALADARYAAHAAQPPSPPGT